MNRTLACVFPETLPDAGLLVPLVQVFDQVVHMQAVENEQPATDSTYSSHCRELGRLQSFTPAPLGEQRDRFMALVEDMRRNGADYTAQLGMLTLAGMQQGGRQRESTHSLISDLLKRTDIRSQEQEQLQLWQSRLILKLGEWFDTQQTDINTTLSHITSRQNDLLHELREEEESPFSLATAAQQSSAETEPMLKHRLRAWTRLCYHNQAQAPGLLVTRQPLAMELLQEVYEKLRKQTASPLVSLLLPATQQEKGPADKPLLAQVAGLQSMMHRLVQPLSAKAAQVLALDWKKELPAWETILEQHYPLAQTGRCSLEFVYFANISAKQLLIEGFDAGRTNAGKSGMVQEEGCCVALLQRV